MSVGSNRYFCVKQLFLGIRSFLTNQRKNPLTEWLTQRDTFVFVWFPLVTVFAGLVCEADDFDFAALAFKSSFIGFVWLEVVFDLILTGITWQLFDETLTFGVDGGLDSIGFSSFESLMFFMTLPLTSFWPLDFFGESVGLSEEYSSSPRTPESSIFDDSTGGWFEMTNKDFSFSEKKNMNWNAIISANQRVH